MASNHTLLPIFHGVNCRKDRWAMRFRVESWAVRASCRASFKEERRSSRAGRKVLPRDDRIGV